MQEAYPKVLTINTENSYNSYSFPSWKGSSMQESNTRCKLQYFGKGEKKNLTSSLIKGEKDKIWLMKTFLSAKLILTIQGHT